MRAEDKQTKKCLCQTRLDLQLIVGKSTVNSTVRELLKNRLKKFLVSPEPVYRAYYILRYKPRR